MESLTVPVGLEPGEGVIHILDERPQAGGFVARQRAAMLVQERAQPDAKSAELMRGNPVGLGPPVFLAELGERRHERRSGRNWIHKP